MSVHSGYAPTIPERARTLFDWLSRDSAVVDAFINDHCVLHNFSPRPMHRFSELRGDCPIRSVFARYAPTCPSTCFRAAKIPWVSNSKAPRS